MKKKLEDLKKWSKKHKKALQVTGYIVAVSAGVALIVTGGIKSAAIQEQKLLDVVTNNLKLKKDGEFVDVIVNRYSDDYTKTIVARRWTKVNGELLYLGRQSEVEQLTENEMIVKQLDKIGRGVASTVSQFTKR